MVIRDMLETKYGGQVSIEYIDVVQDAKKLNNYPDAQKALSSKPVSALPLVTVNRQPLAWGPVCYPDLVEQIKEMGIDPVS